MCTKKKQEKKFFFDVYIAMYSIFCSVENIIGYNIERTMHRANLSVTVSCILVIFVLFFRNLFIVLHNILLFYLAFFFVIYYTAISFSISYSIRIPFPASLLFNSQTFFISTSSFLRSLDDTSCMKITPTDNGSPKYNRFGCQCIKYMAVSV